MKFDDDFSELILIIEWKAYLSMGVDEPDGGEFLKMEKCYFPPSDKPKGKRRGTPFFVTPILTINFPYRGSSD